MVKTEIRGSGLWLEIDHQSFQISVPDWNADEDMGEDEYLRHWQRNLDTAVKRICRPDHATLKDDAIGVIVQTLRENPSVFISDAAEKVVNALIAAKLLGDTSGKK